MAFASTTIWECNTGANDTTCGGGFDPANPNMATDLAATSATGASPVVTSASYTFLARDVNMYVYIQAGTNWIPGWYKIASVSAGAATLDASVGAVVLAGNGALNTTAGCASTASPTGGTWSIDYSQKATSIFNYGDMVIGVTTTTYTSVLNPVGPHLVGNTLSVLANTGWTVQRVQIVSVSSLTATCDKSLGTTGSVNGTAGLGGALKSPALAAGVHVADNYIFIRNTGGASNTIYDMSNSANVAGGKLFDNSAGTGARGTWYVGYETTRTLNNRDANRPILRANANSVVCMELDANQIQARNIITDNNAAKTGTTGFYLGAGSVRLERCSALNQTFRGIDVAGGTGFLIDVSADACANGVNLVNATMVGFSIKNCTGNALNMSAESKAFQGVISGAGGVGINITSARATVGSVTVYGCTGDNVAMNAGQQQNVLVNVISYASVARNFNLGTDGIYRLFNCAGGAGGTADAFNANMAEGFITLTADPFTNAAGGDFSLNNNAGGGALLRGLASMTAFYSYPTIVNALDVGGYQQQGGVVTNTYVLSQRVTQYLVDR